MNFHQVWHCIITKADGSVSAPLGIKATVLQDRDVPFTFEDTEVTIQQSVDFAPLTETSGRGRVPNFIVNEIQTFEQKIIITQVKPKGQDMVEITGIFDDERVHLD